MKHADSSAIDAAQRLAKAEKRALKVLGLRQGASLPEIKRAYWLLAMQCHPDRNPRDKQAAERFRLITAAYEFLTGKSVDDDFGRDKREHHDHDPARSKKYHTDNAWGHFLWWRDRFF